MSDLEKPHFSKSILRTSEGLQRAVGHTMVGGLLMRALTGSSSPNYQQLDWFSHDVDSTVHNTVMVGGNHRAAKLARNWDMAMIMGTPDDELDELAALGVGQKEAVGYISDEVLHVGVAPGDEDESMLFGGHKSEPWSTVAMRKGRGPLEATMGVWLPEDRLFISVRELYIVKPDIHIGMLEQQYPKLPLV
jgi:hypothetical protein